jgi:hypothetical protein
LRYSKPYQLRADANGYFYAYEGRFICSLLPYDVVPWDYFSQVGTQWWIDNNRDPDSSKAAQYGSQAWHKFKPGQSEASLGVFLGELTDLPRMLKTSAYGFVDAYKAFARRSGKKLTKQASDHFLNTQFGWMPFVSDLRKMYNLSQHLDQAIKQLRRDNNQWIKRSGTVDKEETMEVRGPFPGQVSFPILYNKLYVNPSAKGEYTFEDVIRYKVHFTARFKYYIPNIESVAWGRKAKRALFGLNLNPQLIWELTPWSWLVDWVADVGKLLEQFDNGLAENLVAKYAYVANTYDSYTRVKEVLNLNTGNLPNQWNYGYRRYSRDIASPFGFEMSNNDLSVRQKLILGALGISRAL